MGLLLLICSCGPKAVAPLLVLGQWHTVQKGDTVDRVAAQYQVEPELIADLNDIPAKGEIVDRNEIFIPKSDGAPPGTGATPTPPVGDGPSQNLAEKNNKSKSGTSSNVSGYCGVKNRPCFLWPTNGEFSSGFGPRGGKHHDGIDIVAPKGTPIKAAEDGVVIYSGDAIKGYGNMVLIRHTDNIITIYAHNDKNIVEEGESAKRGQTIANMGNTGSASTNHLHFEVRVNEQPVDPLLYLPTKE